MDYQITYPNKLFKTVKLKGIDRKIFIFKDKNRVTKIALAFEIVGYGIFIAGLILSLVCLFNERIRIEFARTYTYIALVIITLAPIYALICIALDKVFNYDKKSGHKKRE